MTEPRTHRRWIVLAFVLAVAALAAIVWRYGYRQALDQLAQRAEADLALASDRLNSQLQVYQELAVLVSDHPGLVGLEHDPRRREAARRLLLEIADKTSAMDVIYADSTGAVLAAAQGLPGPDLSAARYFQRAMQGALGTEHGIKAPLNQRAYYYAAPAFDRSGKVRGALVVVADVEGIESTWRGDAPAVFFTDADGEVFISNRSEILFWSRPPGAAGLLQSDGSVPEFSAGQVGPHQIWTLGWGPYLPQRALYLDRDLPVIGMTGHVLVDAAPARRLAGLQASALAAICLAFGALLFLATERRHTLAVANAELERRVGERTRALSAINARLRSEVSEREEAEAALKRAQAELVQAGKLSALGQMSAGISHELNQPLMAIRSFAENGGQLLDRGRTEIAAENLTRISELARRMGRIIKNLRAFARQEIEAAGRVDIVAVLGSAIELISARLRQEDITLHYDPPSHPIWVLGGEVRLEQVFVNLIGNASDAMSASPDKSLRIAITDGETVTVTVHDSGPGIDMPDKVFEPFYSTKEVGGSEGMGLGLSISYGIVQSLGGDIRGTNPPDGGALFTVRLERWVEEQAA